MVDLITAGLLLVFAGLGVMGASLLLEGRSAGGEVKSTGVVMLGPIPIIFGSDMKWASVAIALAIVLVLLAIMLNLA
jgi:uncharacterized protein (TIGR00304 family)